MQSEEKRGVGVAGQMGWGSTAPLGCCSPAALTDVGLSAHGAGGFRRHEAVCEPGCPWLVGVTGLRPGGLG